MKAGSALSTKKLSSIKQLSTCLAIADGAKEVRNILLASRHSWQQESSER